VWLEARLEELERTVARGSTLDVVSLVNSMLRDESRFAAAESRALEDTLH
jgi:hypothetical protein